MKRNKEKSRQSRSGTSPYRRYQKAETVYSNEYYAWFQATTGQRHRLDLGRRQAQAKPVSSSRRPLGSTKYDAWKSSAAA